MVLTVRDVNAYPLEVVDLLEKNRRTAAGRRGRRVQFQSTLCKVLSRPRRSDPIALAIQRRPTLLCKNTSVDSIIALHKTKERLREAYKLSSSFVPRSLTPDPKRIGAKSFDVLFDLQRRFGYALKSSKWAGRFWVYITHGRRIGALKYAEECSLKWLVFQYVRRDTVVNERSLEISRAALQKDETTYSVAVQCLTGVEVVKYGRKGKPHKTHLIMKGKESVSWESKAVSKMASLSLLKKRNREQKSILFVSILDVRPGQSTKVFTDAIRKGVAGSPAHCLSLITSERTLDLRAQSQAQRDWLVTSFQSLVAQALDKQKASARHVELNIVRRLQQVDIVKHGRRGRPHSTKLTVHKNGVLSWKGRSGASIYFEDVHDIVRGKGSTEVFRRAKSSPKDRHCVSILTAERTLDIEAKTEDARDWLYVAFKYLTQRCKERRREIQRQQLERQQRYLLHRSVLTYG